MTHYILTTRAGSEQFPTLAAASAAYSAARDASGEGMVTWPAGKVTAADGRCYFISYNGRVWATDPCRPDWRPGEAPLFCPAEAA